MRKYESVKGLKPDYQRGQKRVKDSAPVAHGFIYYAHRPAFVNPADELSVNDEAFAVPSASLGADRRHVTHRHPVPGQGPAVDA